MTIEKNAYLTIINNKIAYDRSFKSVESNSRYARFINQNNIQVNGSAVEYLLTWPKEGINWANDLSIHKGDEFKRKVNAVPFRLFRLIDKVYYAVINEERFLEALESDSALKDFTNKLIEQTADKINIDLEVEIPKLICNDENFVEYDETTKKGNLYQVEAEKFNDPIWIHEQIFNGSAILRKFSADFNKGYLIDPDDKSQGYEPLETNISSYQKMVVILDSKIRNKTVIGGYKENVNFQAMDLEKRFGKENIYEDNLPNDYGMILMDERCLQLYKRAKKEGFRYKDESENGNHWFFLNPVIHGGFITAFNALAWKIKPKTATE
jgi:hypothetical protein